MYIVREVFMAKPGQASKLAKLFRRAFVNASKIRIMTDMVGEFNTVVAEMEVANLTEFEQQMADYRAGKPDPNMDPKAMEELSKYTEMWVTGRREIYQVID